MPLLMTRHMTLVVLATLLLAIASCGPKPLRPIQGSTQKPPIADRLESPLLQYADELAATAPQENHVQLLEIGSDALLARIHLIRCARKNIAIQTMIWVNDETGRLVMFELIQAARRGVQVRLLIDHLASEQHIEIAAFLARVHPNLQVKLYNPVMGLFNRPKAQPSSLDIFFDAVLHFNRINQRMHNKTFIVDGRLGITGGRNYQNAYYDQARGMNYKDRDLMVIGPVAAAMQQSFEDYWSFEYAYSLSALADVETFQQREHKRSWNSRENFRLNGLFTEIEREADEPRVISEKFVLPLRRVEQASFIADDPFKRERPLLSANGYSKIPLQLAEMVTNAQRSITIQTPYLVLTNKAIALFKDLRKSQPQIAIRISTNSLAATDSWYVYALSYKQKQTYLTSLDFKIFEFKPQPGNLLDFVPTYDRLISRELTPEERQKAWRHTRDPVTEDDGPMLVQETWEPEASDGQPYLCLHSKTLVIDDEVTFIGSYNLDPRSENINTEGGIVIRDTDFAREVVARIETDMAPRNSWVIARKQRPLGVHQTNAVLVKLSDLLPLLDIWPFRYASSYELIEGRPDVDTEHPDFYKNYLDVGSFPEVEGKGAGKAVGARGTKAFLSFVKPLL